jgi:hypothetical protein
MPKMLLIFPFLFLALQASGQTAPIRVSVTVGGQAPFNDLLASKIRRGLQQTKDVVITSDGFDYELSVVVTTIGDGRLAVSTVLGQVHDFSDCSCGVNKYWVKYFHEHYRQIDYQGVLVSPSVDQAGKAVITAIDENVFEKDRETAPYLEQLEKEMKK